MTRVAKASLFQKLEKVLSDNSMSIALFSLFLVCITFQSLSGWFAYNQSLQEGHFKRIEFWAYLLTGNFLDGVFSNWQAAVLQLAVLIAFSSVLRQKGAAHSRKSGGYAEPGNHRTVKWKFRARPTIKEWFYANSLSIAFCTLFAITFTLHAVFGDMKYDEDQALRHLPPISLGPYLTSAGFWFSVFQTWEAEFFAIALYIVLSIFLRQEGSSESKPVGASTEQTGETNE
jgi:hypothetical protein